MRRTVLVVEDDAAIRRGLADALRAGGYDVLEAADGPGGRDLALRAAYDLLLLDLMLPGLDGLEVLDVVRRARPTVAVIIVTARGAEDERVAGLARGADDYVVKPFGARELLARVEAVLRRSPERPLDVAEVAVSGGTIDLERRELRPGDERCSVPLTERELAILRYLAIHPGRTVSREELLSRVWGLDATGLETRTVDMHIMRLREKLRRTGMEEAVETVRGRGYRFSARAEPGRMDRA